MKDTVADKNRGDGLKRPRRMLQVLLLDICISALASFIAVLVVRWLGDPFGSLQHFIYVWVLSGVICSFQLKSK